MDPRLHHPLPILTYMAQAHAPDGLPPQLPPMPAMPGVASTSAPDGGAVSDADLDKHMIAKGLARLPEPHSDADLELLWRTLSNEVREFLRHPRPDIVIAIAERTSNIVLIRRTVSSNAACSTHTGRLLAGKLISPLIERRLCRS